MNEDTMRNLENFSSKIEVIEKVVSVINKCIWEDIKDASYVDREKAIIEVGSLTILLSESIESRNVEIDSIINSISQLK